MASNSIAKVILTYFAVALIIFLAANISLSEAIIPIFISILLLIPIYAWYKNCVDKKELSKEIELRDKGLTFFWIFTLFILALSIRIPSALSFAMPYEKTPLIYLLVLTIVLIEKTNVSAYGFKSKNIGKALLYGLIFYLILGGLASLILDLLIYAFTHQLPILSYSIMPFLLAMPFHTLCVGVSEEGLFRGYIQTRLEKFSRKKAILFQAILFGVWHFVWNLSPFDPLGMALYITSAFLIGLIFGYLYSKARNLAPLVLAHGLWNSVPQGIITNEAALNALQEMAISNQLFMWLLPYAISTILAIFFIKYLVKEI